MTDSRC